MPALSYPYSGPTLVRPAHFDPQFPLMFGGHGAWQCYAYPSVQRVIFDYRSFGNAYMPSGDDYLIGSNLNQTDPPLHGQLRGLVTAPFTRAAISAREDAISEQCRALLEPLVAQGNADFIQDFAFPLTTAIIGELMGIPEAAYGNVNGWAKAIVTAGYRPDGMEKAAVAQQEMFRLFHGLLELRLQRPQQDLLSGLATATLDGELLVAPIKVATCMTVLLAGHETTAALLGNAMQVLAELPQLQDHLRSHPQDTGAALSEVLRLRPSLVSMYRIAREDIELEGCRIKAGEMVNAWISTANRDPSMFADPDSFELQRGNGDKALSFGMGIHRCLGETLAKAEARIALAMVLSLTKDISLNGAAVAQQGGIVCGLESLPVRFTPNA